MYYKTTYLSPVGLLTIACDSENLVGLWIEGQKYFGQSVPADLIIKDDIPIFIQTKNWLDRYFEGKKPAISELPLAPAGSAFRQTVWNVLCEIPYGEVITYSHIAKIVAAKMQKEHMSCQAVGGAVGHNPISIIIPCHRVVGANGSLTGYAGGIDAKAKLLRLEGVDLTRLFVPKRGPHFENRSDENCFGQV